MFSELFRKFFLKKSLSLNKITLKLILQTLNCFKKRGKTSRADCGKTATVDSHNHDWDWKNKKNEKKWFLALLHHFLKWKKNHVAKLLVFFCSTSCFGGIKITTTIWLQNSWKCVNRSFKKKSAQKSSSSLNCKNVAGWVLKNNPKKYETKNLYHEKLRREFLF